MPQDAPDKVIDIPGHGQIAFPASMSDADIEKAAATLYKQSNPSHPEPAKEHSWLSRAVDWLPTAGGAAGGIIGGIGGTAFGMGIGGVPGAVGGAAVGGATGEALKQLAHRAMGDESAPTSMGEAAAGMGGQAALQGGAELAGGLLVKGAAKAAPALMQSALKPAYKTVEKAVKNVEMPRVVKTLLDEGVNVTSGGIGKINSLLSATNKELDDIIANSTAKVFPENVIKAAEPVLARAGNQVAPMGDRAAAEGVIDEFARVHGGAPTYPMTPMRVQEAQALKQGTYKALGARAYGETKGAALETEKALARGLKEGIETAHPEVKGLNAREGALIEAKDAIAKRVALAGNRDPGGIGWIAEDPKSFMAFVMARSPAVKSMLARGLYQSAAKASRVPENLIRFGMQSLATLSDEDQP